MLSPGGQHIRTPSYPGMHPVGRIIQTLATARALVGRLPPYRCDH
jgi:hypothetical protein